MLDFVKLIAVGPAPEMSIHFHPRMNIITGDNGLGKTFLLDVAWWALTRTWANHIALPSNGRQASIQFQVRGKSSDAHPSESRFRREEAQWPIPSGRPVMPGIVIYVRVDGGFSVWDPARNYWRNTPDRPAAYHFDANAVWDGLRIGTEEACEGLERDWVNWQEGNKPEFETLRRVLETLSPVGEPIRPGLPKRLLIGQGRARPTLMIGDETIPLVLASSGIRRILALAYLLVWAWTEHRVAAELLGKPAETRFVVLFDEPETHLHPRWQRTVLPSLLRALETLATTSAQAQIITATHSPLVIASLEPYFDPSKDDLFLLHQRDGRILLDEDCWTMHGDVTNWLVSDIFGLPQARSLEAEQAIEAAEAWMRDESAAADPFKSAEEIDQALRRLLPHHDPFWPRWILHRSPKSIAPTSRRKGTDK